MPNSLKTAFLIAFILRSCQAKIFNFREEKRLPLRMFLGLDKEKGIQLMLVCWSQFLFSCSFNMPIPEFPEYLSKMGGQDYIGLIIALFTLMAGLSRPFSGKLADSIGRIPVMIFGSLVCVVCSLLYPVLLSVSGFLLLRFFHGLSTGFLPTGSSTYVADIIAPVYRGQAMGVLGLSSSLGLFVGPALGSLVTNFYGLDFMFYLSAFCGLISIVISLAIKETLPEKNTFSWRMLHISRKELLEPRVFAPSIVTFLLYAAYGASLTLIPYVSTEVGLSNKGIFFTWFTVGSVGIRVLAGKIPDKYGRVPTLKAASWIMLLSMIAIALTDSSLLFLIAAVVYGISTGLFTPSVAAWTVDLAEEKYRGRAMATMYIAMEAGIGLGALSSGMLFEAGQGQSAVAFLVMGMLALLAYIYLQIIYPFQLEKMKG